MSLALVFVVLSVLSAACAYGESFSVQPTPTVAVFIDFDAEPARASVEAMENAVDQAFESAGVRLDWRLLRENKGREGFNDLVVVRFKGRCRVEWTPVPQNDFGSAGEAVQLGLTYVQNGRVLPYSEIECAQVLRTVPYMDETVTQSQRQRLFGRALGYVVAHELYHALAGTTRHAVNGLAQAKESWRDLLSTGLKFGETDSKAIRQGILQNGGRAVFSFQH